MVGDRWRDMNRRTPGRVRRFWWGRTGSRRCRTHRTCGPGTCAQPRTSSVSRRDTFREPAGLRFAGDSCGRRDQDLCGWCERHPDSRIGEESTDQGIHDQSDPDVSFRRDRLRRVRTRPSSNRSPRCPCPSKSLRTTRQRCHVKPAAWHRGATTCSSRFPSRTRTGSSSRHR